MARRPAPARPRLPATAAQTTGPFFPAQFIRPGDSDLAARALDGERCYICGTVTDAAARPAANVILEIWQASPAGKFDDPSFLGWGRTWTDRDGFYSFTTVKPGPHPVRAGSNRWFAPRIGMRLLGSGLMRPLLTCLYFPGEALNDDDPQLAAITSPAARRRLVAKPDRHAAAPAGAAVLRFDIRLGGRNASTFLQE